MEWANGISKPAYKTWCGLNAKDYEGDTPLHGAAYGAYKEIVELLIANGAEITIKNTKGRTPLDNTPVRKNKDITEILKAKGAMLSEYKKRPPKEYTDFKIEEKGEKNLIKITILYDNYVYSKGTKSHWGFSCLVEGTERTILFDTGWKPEILRNNIEKSKVDIKKVQQIVISHNHGDHTGGVFSVLDKNPNVKVFLPYSFPYDFVRRVESKKAEVFTVSKPVQICKNVYLTGEMGDQIKEHSLILNTQKGLVIITGCSHQGIINVVKRAKEIINKNIYLVLGGFHLLRHKEDEIKEIIGKFKEYGVKFCGPTHCTGENAILLFKNAFGANFIQLGTGKIIKINGKKSISGIKNELIVSARKEWSTKKIFKTPESVLYDKRNNIIYVSNINGSPNEKDGNGFISKLKINGEVDILKWITGLNAPKGMGLYNGKLYVTDIDRLVEIDTEKSRIVNRYTSSPAKFLNDISVHSSGAVYVSDNMANLIFRLKNGKFKVWLKSTNLKEPNGLWAEENLLLIGINNAVLSVDYRTKNVIRFIEETDYVDGLVSKVDGSYLVSDFLGVINLVRPGKKRVKIIDTTAEKVMAADIDFVIEKNLLLVPTFLDNKVVAYKIYD